MLVYAQDADAKSYKQPGFEPPPIDDYRLFLKISDTLYRYDQ